MIEVLGLEMHAQVLAGFRLCFQGLERALAEYEKALNSGKVTRVVARAREIEVYDQGLNLLYRMFKMISHVALAALGTGDSKAVHAAFFPALKEDSVSKAEMLALKEFVAENKDLKDLVGVIEGIEESIRRRNRLSGDQRTYILQLRTIKKLDCDFKSFMDTYGRCGNRLSELAKSARALFKGVAGVTPIEHLQEINPEEADKSVGRVIAGFAPKALDEDAKKAYQ